MNSSKQEEQRELRQCVQRQDLIQVYFEWIISHSPLIFIFVNVVLVIWIAQTVFQSKLNAIPNSIYLVSPFLTADAFSKIQFQPANKGCQQGTQPLALKTFPTIYQLHIFHQSLYKWGKEPLQICASRIPKFQKKIECDKDQVKCSGYCVSSLKNCPITKIKINSNSTLSPGFQQIYASNGKYYQISRSQGTPIVGIAASYQPKCANDEYFSYSFDNQTEFWNRIRDCGNEGTLSTFYNQIDQIPTNEFFAANKIGITVTDLSLSQMFLGTIFQFSLSKDESCSSAYEKMENIKKYLEQNPSVPQFSQSLLIISFILLTGQITWLIAYYCFPGLTSQKNIIVTMLSIIQVVVIGFIYSQNRELFQMEDISKMMTVCLKQSIPALREWDFGIKGPEVFQSILFVNTTFLGLYFSSLFFNFLLFQDYQRHLVNLPQATNNNYELQNSL